MEKISANISYKEATLSPTAQRLGIDNTPDSEVLYRMKLVASKCFEPIRSWYGKPIKINSFYRSPELNKAIGGALNPISQHVLGEAIDIDADGDNLKIFEWIRKNLEFDQCIAEGDEGNGNPLWIHISFSNMHPNRQQVMKADFTTGKATYKFI